MAHSKILSSAILTGLLVATLGSHASAASAVVVCTPTNVAFSTTNGGEVSVNCGTGWYIGNASCGGANLDIVKAWLSMVQAAMLAGTNIEIVTEECTMIGPRIIWMQLNK